MVPERIQYKSTHPAGETSGLLFGDPKSGSKGVLLIHEWWGIDDWTLETAKEIQKAGFVVLVADIFRGKLFTEHREAGHNLRTFDYRTGSLDVLAGVQFLKESGCSRVALVGFSFGALLALVSAATLADYDLIDAVATHCGVPRPETADLGLIRCPVQGHYALYDTVRNVSTPEVYNAMATRLQEAGVPLEMCIYEAGHAFSNPAYDAYNPEQTEKFYANLFRFLHEKLSV